MSIFGEQMYEKQLKKITGKSLTSKSSRICIKSILKSSTKGFIGNNDVTYSLQHFLEKNSIKPRDLSVNFWKHQQIAY